MSKYDQDFRFAFYEMVISSGKSITAVASEMKIPKSSATRMIRQVKVEKETLEDGTGTVERKHDTSANNTAGTPTTGVSATQFANRAGDLLDSFKLLSISEKRVLPAGTARRVCIDELVSYLKSLQQQEIAIDDLVQYLMQLPPLPNCVSASSHLSVRAKSRDQRRMEFTPYTLAHALKNDRWFSFAPKKRVTHDRSHFQCTSCRRHRLAPVSGLLAAELD